MSLTAKQQLFVNEYLLSHNATRAAEAAGYSKKSAHTQGSRLFKDAEVKEAIEKGMAREFDAKSEKVVLTKERWLKELRLIALANMDDYAVIEKTEVTHGKRKSTVTTVTPVATKDRHRSLGRVIKKISETKNGIGIELHSKQAALDTLGKHYGWVKNDVALTTPDSVKVVLTMPDNGRSTKSEGPSVNDAPQTLPSPKEPVDGGN